MRMAHFPEEKNEFFITRIFIRLQKIVQISLWPRSMYKPLIHSLQQPHF